MTNRFEIVPLLSPVQPPRFFGPRSLLSVNRRGHFAEDFFVTGGEGLTASCRSVRRKRACHAFSGRRTDPQVQIKSFLFSYLSLRQIVCKASATCRQSVWQTRGRWSHLSNITCRRAGKEPGPRQTLARTGAAASLRQSWRWRRHRYRPVPSVAVSDGVSPSHSCPWRRSKFRTPQGFERGKSDGLRCWSGELTERWSGEARRAVSI